MTNPAPANVVAVYLTPIGHEFTPERLAALHSTRVAVTAVVTERDRHLTTEGWTPEHDDQYTDGSLAQAAAAYLAASVHGPAAGMECWPWDLEWFKPGNPLHVPEDRLRCLDKAGALLLAERERLDRAGKAPQ
ncbi:hypothetical protein [Deinococcus sp. PEB2-67]